MVLEFFFIFFPELQLSRRLETESPVGDNFKVLHEAKRKSAKMAVDTTLEEMMDMLGKSWYEESNNFLNFEITKPNRNEYKLHKTGSYDIHHRTKIKFKLYKIHYNFVEFCIFFFVGTKQK